MIEKEPTLDWNDEYRRFLDSSRRNPPRELSATLKKAVRAELNPPQWRVLAKLFAIHFIAGAATLFAFHGKAEGLPIFNIFHGLGEYGCMIACGAFFLGATALCAAFLLRSSELRVIRKSRGLQWAFLTFLSVGFFLAFEEQEGAIPVGLVAAWVVGAVLGSSSVFGLGYAFRSRVRHHFNFWH